MKVWNPETQQYEYIPEEEVPMAWETPKTGDDQEIGRWLMMAACALAGMGLAGFPAFRRRREEE